MPTSVALTPHFETLTQQLVASGRYNNVSEVIRDGLRLLEDRMLQDAAKLASLREAAKNGFDDIEQGNFVILETAEDIENMVRQAGERAAGRIKAAA